MDDQGKSGQDIEVLRERISNLSAAILRINATLDLDSVLREVVESARELTSARYGIIATIDEAGVPQEFVYSGFTSEEHQELGAWSDALPLFEHLRDLPGPLRVADLSGYVRSLGLKSTRMFSKAFQGTPMRHQGVQVGNFFLAEKAEDEEFTDEDEEVLTLFASQAAAAVANARTHRNERRARADIEALIETSPFGVVVFDATADHRVTFNREARRIVSGLLLPGSSPEDLLGVVTCRRSDGREVALNEVPLVQMLRIGETVRAEEIVLSVPDGRSITVLINATPIRSEDGEIGSVVVTMQDLGPLEEIERMRAEFLGLVSHELREPLMAITGSAATLLGTDADLDPAEMRAFHHIIHTQANHMRGIITDLLDAGRIEAGTLTVEPEPSELATLVDRARNTFLSGGGRHAVLVDLSPSLPPVLADRRCVVQVLTNLFANATRHAPESTSIRVAAVLDGEHVAVSVSDEGPGIPPEHLPHLFRKHVALDGDVGKGVAGAGLGLAICKGLVEAHGGRIWAESGGPGQGAQLTFTLPVTEETASASPEPRTGNEPLRVLVVDDDPQTLRFVRKGLEEAGYAPVLTNDPEEVSGLIRAKRPHLVLLDLRFPGTDGIEMMESIPGLADLPIIFISAYGRDETIVRALEAGAVDYIVKPFSSTELIARVGAALRKRAEPETFVLGDLVIEYEQRRVSVAGRPVTLTPTEYELLRLLSINAGRVTMSESLIRQLWEEGDLRRLELLRNFVKKLRTKLGDSASNPSWIFNHRGVGYSIPKPDGE